MSNLIGLNWIERFYYWITGDSIEDKHVYTLYYNTNLTEDNKIVDTIYSTYVLKVTNSGQRYCETKSSSDFWTTLAPETRPIYLNVVWPWLQGDKDVLLNYLKSQGRSIPTEVYWDAGYNPTKFEEQSCN